MKKKRAVWFLLGLGCVVLVAGGCAKQEMVKKDEPIAPVAAVAAKAPVTEKVAKEAPVKTTPLQESAAKETAPSAEQLKTALEKIYFDFDSFKLSREARGILAKNAELMKGNAVAKVRIEGNCDERGSDEYNLALGEKRAKEAMKYLVTMGIPAEHLSVISYGKEKPADPGHNDAAWAKNRRDEFVAYTN